MHSENIATQNLLSLIAKGEPKSHPHLVEARGLP